MSKFVLLAADNRAVGFYDDLAGATVPAAAVPISDALWLDWIQDTAGRVYDAATQSLAPLLSASQALTKDQLLSCAYAKASAIEAAGVTVNVAPAGAAPIEVQCSTTSAYVTKLTGAVQRAALDPTAVLHWEQRDGSVLNLTATQTQALGLAVANWVQSIWDERTLHVQPAIVAGTITTTAQIDDPTTASLPAWPTNS